MSKVANTLAAPIGILVAGRIIYEIFPKDTLLPATCIRNFKTTVDYQKLVIIHFLQGDARVLNKKAKSHVSLGKFFVKGLPEEKKGSGRIEFTFHIDKDAALQVEAVYINSEERKPLVCIKELDAAKCKSITMIVPS